MNTDILRSFVEVARQSSYTAAAKVLCVSQPTAYQHVKALERQLGVQLVRQFGKRVLLTPEGKVVMSQAIRVLDDVGQLFNSVLLDYHEMRSGQLDIMVGTTFGQAILPLGVGSFRVRYPGIAIRAPVSNNTDDIDESVLRLGYDGAFHSNSSPRSGLDKHPLFEDVLVAVVPPNHWLASAGRAVQPDDLTDEGIVTYARPYRMRQTIESWASTRNVAIPSSIELNSQGAMLTAVAAGAGVSVVSLLSAVPFIQAGMVVGIAMEPHLSRMTFFVHRSDSEVPLALTRLAECVSYSAAEMQLNGSRLVRNLDRDPAVVSRNGGKST